MATFGLKMSSLFLLMWGSITQAAYTGAVSSGTANAGVAAVEASETPFFNPATLPHITGYYFSTGYMGGAKGEDAFSVSLTDNMRETVIPTSLAFVQTNFAEGPQKDDQERLIRLSFGNFVGRDFAFGLAVSHQENRTAYSRHAQTNLDIGGLWTLNPSLGFAVLFENVLPTDRELPVGQRIEPGTSLGLSYNYRKFLRAKADIVTNGKNSWSHPGLRGGIEYYLNRWVIGRLGYEKNNFADQSLYSVGFGLKLPKFGLHYAYQSIQENEPDSVHTVDLAIPIW